VREFIQQKARILAVVSMPVGTFMHAGVNPKTSVLFLQKLNQRDLEKLKSKKYPIFMAVVEKVGYDLNSKTPKILYKKNEKGEILKDKDGEPTLDTDVPTIIEAFNEFKRRHTLGF